MSIVSFCIISWNRPEESKTVVDNIISLEDAPGYAKEIVIINNGSDKDYSNFEKFLEERRRVVDFPVTYIRSAENRGVAGGRNLAIQNARGDILVFIDDDAIFEDRQALKRIVSCFENPEFQANRTAVFGFRIVNYYSRQVKPGEFPHKQYSKRINRRGFYTYYFIGCGHAFSRQVIEKTGLYPEDFMYGAEEYDLCYRIIDAGYRIYYCGDITVYHMVSPEGRKPPRFIITRLTENRLLVAYKYLPWQYVLTHLLFWSLFLLWKTRFDPVNLLQMYRSLYLRMQQSRRKPLKPEALAYLREVEARLWY